MAAKKLVPFQPPGRRFVYDNDPDAITRPDTVPAALRFLADEESNPGSGFGHRVERELSAYPSVPEVTRPSDMPTVVDAPLQRATMPTPRVTESYPVIPSEVPQSGPRHRMVSTVPPPRSRRAHGVASRVAPSNDALSQRAASHIAAPHDAAPHGVALRHAASHGAHSHGAPSFEAPRDEQRRQQRPRSDTPVAAHSQRLWPLLLTTSVTTVLAVVIGTSLADGTLARWSLRGFDAPIEQARGLLATSIRVPAPTPLESPKAQPAPTAETSTVPVVRAEDLPLAEEDDRPTPRRRAIRGRHRTARPAGTD